MNRESITSGKAPATAGPYSHAVRAGDYVFVTNQLGVDPQKGEFAEGGVAGQARQAIENLAAILEAAGSSLTRVVKTTVFLVDMSAYPTVDRIYAEFFSHSPPARSTIQVGGLPLGGLVGIDAVALCS